MKKVLFCTIAGLIMFTGVRTFLISPEDKTEALMLENVEALSDGTESSTASYIRIDGTCTYTITGKAGTEVSIFIAGVQVAKIKVGANGTATYSYEGKTDCSAGGKQMCTPRYCPQLSFL